MSNIPENFKELVDKARCNAEGKQLIEILTTQLGLESTVTEQLQARLKIAENQPATIRAMDVYMAPADTNPDPKFMRDFFREKLGDAIRHASAKN